MGHLLGHPDEYYDIDAHDIIDEMRTQGWLTEGDAGRMKATHTNKPNDKNGISQARIKAAYDSYHTNVGPLPTPAWPSPPFMWSKCEGLCVTNSMISGGGTLTAVHYLPFWDAVVKLTGKYTNMTPADWEIVPDEQHIKLERDYTYDELKPLLYLRHSGRIKYNGEQRFAVVEPDALRIYADEAAWKTERQLSDTDFNEGSGAVESIETDKIQNVQLDVHGKEVGITYTMPSGMPGAINLDLESQPKEIVHWFCALQYANARSQARSQVFSLPAECTHCHASPREPGKKWSWQEHGMIRCKHPF